MLLDTIKKSADKNPPPIDVCCQLQDCRIFFEFDNTITLSDILDDIIKKFAINRDWMRYEEL